MVLVAAALVRKAGLVPRVRVIYSRSDGDSAQNPLEFLPVATTIAAVIASCCGVEVTLPSAPADVDLFVRVSHTRLLTVGGLSFTIHVDVMEMEVRWRNPRKVRKVNELRSKGGDTEKITINLGFVDLGHIDLMVHEGF